MTEASSYGGIPRYVPAEGECEQAAIGRDYLNLLTSVAEQCGAIGQYSRRGAPVILVSSPELARALLVDQAGDLTKGALQHTAFRVLLGQSLSMSEGERHGQLRRLLAPAFTRRQIGRYTERIAATADTVFASWALLDEIDLFTELHRLTLHTLGPVLVAEPALWEDSGAFWQARERVWRWINQVAGEHRDFDKEAHDTCTPEVIASISTMQDTIDRIIQERARERCHEDVLTDILQANIRAGEPLAPIEVRDQLLAFLFAAHETNAAALFWSLHLLATYPENLQRVELEVDQAFKGQLHHALDLARLPYTLAVIKEAMRLYPPAARQFRIARRDMELAGYSITKGTAVSVCQYALHRNSDAFPDPHQFVPERFAPGAMADRSAAYLPFGAGDQICLGRQYALQEIHLLLAMLVARYRFEFPGSVQPHLAVVLRPRDNVHVRIEPKI